jgi:hypothetical protein
MSSASASKDRALSSRVVFNDAQTNVQGYFNQHTWPVNIAISKLGRTITLNRAGDYIVDSEGKKVNDPIFEQYVGPMQLSREMTQNGTLIPIVKVKSLSEAADMQGHSVRVADNFVNDPRTGSVKAVLRPVSPSQGDIKDVQKSSVMGMTIDEARRRKFIRPTVEPNQNALKDTSGVPVHGQHLEEIDYAKDLTPGLAAKLKAEGKVVSPPPAAESVEIPDEEENPLTRSLQGQMQEAMAKNPDDPNFLTKISRQVTQAFKSTPAPAPTPSVNIIDNLPQPDLTTPPDPNPRPLNVENQKKFVCELDGQGFEFRSQLERHCLTWHPDQVQQLMARFPKPPSKPKPVFNLPADS